MLPMTPVVVPPVAGSSNPSPARRHPPPSQLCVAWLQHAEMAVPASTDAGCSMPRCCASLRRPVAARSKASSERAAQTQEDTGCGGARPGRRPRLAAVRRGGLQHAASVESTPTTLPAGYGWQRAVGSHAVAGDLLEEKS